ncbi:Protein of unknown function (DUF1068 [Striga hermonthica]|uniref:Uncharacterized protein n=1 Tax=Striga hermonthica TaxID=68872 RepID=A0A9N7MKF2_STRHE|nr:Protein of unknown function (DUF1068 [Striga hermonthica]
MTRRSAACLRCCLVIFAVVSALCVSGPALYFKLNKRFKLKGVSASCPPCNCKCAPPQSLFQIVPGLANLTVTDCGKDDPDVKEEMEKQIVDLLSEELKLQETVSGEHSQHMNITLGEAKRLASQYQKEAEKCNAATETCEGAREKSVVLLTREKKITALWEKRARLLGWEDSKNLFITGSVPVGIPAKTTRALRRHLYFDPGWSCGAFPLVEPIVPTSSAAA